MSDLKSVLTQWFKESGEASLTPQLVVDRARPEGAPLHDRFEWDDSVAGEKYRLHQASQIIRSVRISFTDESGEQKFLRGFHSVREAGDQDGDGYRPTEDIVEDEVALRLLLRQCEREIAEIKRKYGHLQEFATLMRAAVA